MRLTTDVLIVGAGPYGIALSYDLHRKGTPFVIVGQPFSLWRRHVLASATLRSDINASNVFSRDNRLSLRGYLRRTYDRAEASRLMSQRIPVPVFRDYAAWVLAGLPYKPIERKVTRLCRDGRAGGPFLAELEDGTEVVARRVVLASGIESHRWLPECLRHLPSGRVAHSWDVGAFEGTTGKRVLVVGGGQSAAEVLAHLARTNQVTWVHRSGLVFFAEPINLPRPLFALVLRLSAGMFFLPPPLRRVLGRVFVASTITPDLKATVLDRGIRRLRADVSALGLEEGPGGLHSPALDGSFDSVISCTGYRYSLETLRYLDPALRGQIETAAPGIPRLGYDFATSVPGLYMIGGLAEPTHGPAQRFMMGCRTATLRVSRALGR